jgi:chromosome segregation ATPase
MEEANLDDLRKELAALEAEEAHVSAERRRLHDRIDYGFATETTQAREREVSEHRRQLHRRIDELRERLGMTSGRPASSSHEPSVEQVPRHGSIREL